LSLQAHEIGDLGSLPAGEESRSEEDDEESINEFFNN